MIYAWGYIEFSKTRFYGENIDHPMFAIELGVGCTVGCSFCAFDAKKLEVNYDYNIPENRDLFISAQVTTKSLGKIF